MEKPKACTCGGVYKKTPAPANNRDGSRYFKCQRCGARIEQTANGYEFRDAAPPGPIPVPAPPAPPSPPPRRFW
ncbi:MAG: hypothetical protein M9894_25575 [Planctomycetes bacterium]|nr:hypothetical protein [Planctomycetota bacterium]